MRNSDDGAVHFLGKIHKGLQFLTMAGVVSVVDLAADDAHNGVDNEHVDPARDVLRRRSQAGQVGRRVERAGLAVLVARPRYEGDFLRVRSHLN